jgi:heterodisulfide reductase subunit B
MRYTLFIGCQIPARVNQYEMAVRAVCKQIGIKLVDERQFNCCGYPMRNNNPKAFLLSAVRNLALAERAGLDMLVLCKCCYGSLKKAEHLMKEQGEHQDQVRRMLMNEGLGYEGKIRITHFLSLLYHNIGIDALKEKISRPFKGLKIAVHYGCHALRPSNITEFDNPVAPTLFDDLVMVTGAVSVDWNKKLECCGAPLMGINNALSISLMSKKVDDCKAAGAEYLCTACPYCQMQFDTVQQMVVGGDGGNGSVASILYPQLLGLSMGMDEKRLGMDLNQIDILGIRAYLNEE